MEDSATGGLNGPDFPSSGNAGSSRTPAVRCPEILAPAGNLESFGAALASGADAVYLGLSEGFNARARSTDFTLENLAELTARAHAANTRLYLTLNTLVFEEELGSLELLLRKVAACGVDALIVQDPATALLARRLCPSLRLHASTQMTVSSAEGAQFAATLGFERVVLPRELSAREIGLFTKDSPLESEVFVHGALCMAWSGQCLTSEAFSERSANRGQCSQACRMPYEAIVDGAKLELGDQRYLLSPADLAAHEALPDLLAAGVHSLKIEGRYKGPAYVGAAVESWQHWRDALLRGPTDQDRERHRRNVEKTQLTFSRGGSVGFLRGDDHQTLVLATTPKHRGIGVGVVRDVARRSVLVALTYDQDPTALLKPGVGIKFELVGRSAKEHDPDNAPGGPLFGVRFPELGSRPLAELRFGEPGPDLSRVRPGDLVRLTADPEVTREFERRSGLPVFGRIPVELSVEGRAGATLELRAIARAKVGTFHAEVHGKTELVPARNGHGLDETLIGEKLATLGGTPFHVAALDTAGLEPGLHVPVSELKQLRRDLVEGLQRQLNAPRYAVEPLPSTVPAPSVLPALRRHLGENTSEDRRAPELVPLCRTEAQLDALLALGLGRGAEVELDWMEMVGLAKAVAKARAAGLRVTLATVRVQKPGEEAYDRRVAGLAPDGVLVRHWGALMHFAQRRKDAAARGISAPDEGTKTPTLLLHGDFSLNVANSLTACHLLGLGLDTVTASHDLNKAQLTSLLGRVPRGRVAVTLHHHISTFHNSHCVYAHLLSKGADYRSCGRPCEKHRLALRDYAGHEHPVVVDVSCRNTVFNATAQSAAPLVPQLLELGVRRFRVEFVWEEGDQVAQTWRAYRKLLSGELSPKAALEAAAVHERYGVTTPLRLKRR